MPESNCERCDAPFLVTKPNKRFCSLSCQRSAALATRKAVRLAERIWSMTCPACGSDFEPAGNWQKFCSRRCSARTEARRRLGITDPGLSRSCWWCDRPFTLLDGRRLYCEGKCARYVKSLWNLGRYGITRDQYRAAWRAQGGTCAICKQPERSVRNDLLSVDHDHDTGKFRGLLCSHCNRGVGLFGDNPGTLRAAIEYLEESHG